MCFAHSRGNNSDLKRSQVCNVKMSDAVNTSDDLLGWTCEGLQRFGLPVSDENAKYLLSIDDPDDLKDYLHELLGKGNSEVDEFISKLLAQRLQLKDQQENNYTVYKKERVEELFYANFKPEKTHKQTSQNQSIGPDKTKEINGVLTAPNFIPKKNHKSEDSKKKTKFVPLYSQEGQEKTVIQLPGRHPCECQAAKHKLVSNCTKCGRIVCAQEGSGPCVFCGNLVCTPEEQEIMARGSKKSEQLRARLMKEGINADYLKNAEQKMQEGLEKAIQHKEKLLNYDRTSVRRTQVIDDESDYFSTDSNKWLSKKQREALRKREEEKRAQRFGSRKDRKITLDFAGRKVVEDGGNSGAMYDVNDEVIQEVHYGARPKTQTFINDTSNDAPLGRDIVNPTVPIQPQFVAGREEKKPTMSLVVSGSEGKKKSRIQDKELQEMSDEGMCLSMHQPWASLLVAGIKMHEGRSWYSAHRGRLWIAATAKAPSHEEINSLEEDYRFICKDPNLQFPKDYPVGCLLGCVDVVDCLAQDEYREKYPDGESASSFVFICESPQQLIVKFPIKGKHKIYKLDSHIHQAAKKGLS